MPEREHPTVVKAEGGWSMRLTSVATLAKPEGGAILAVRAAPTSLTGRFGRADLTGYIHDGCGPDGRAA
jgi:hypothetical protein